MVLRKEKDLYSSYSPLWDFKWKMREARWVGDEEATQHSD